MQHRRSRRTTLAVEALETRRLLAQLLVNTTADIVDANDGVFSLREAILEANALPGGDQILFDIPGPGPHTIELTSVLPVISGGLTNIDATSQAGWSVVTRTPVVEISGAKMPDDEPLLILGSAQNTIKGLAVNRSRGVGIFVAPHADGNVITQNYVGVDVTGSSDRGNRYQGVYVASNDNQITNNLISGNDANGVWISGTDGTTGQRNLLSGNQIGTNAAGNAAIANSGDGVRIAEGATDNLVDTNLISGNAGTGVLIISVGTDRNQLINNKLGTDLTGTSSVANGTWGVIVADGSENTIGQLRADGQSSNLVSGNREGGIAVIGVNAVGNQITNNFVGTDATGLLRLGNGFVGLYSGSSTGILLPVTGSAVTTKIDSNVVSANSNYGIWIEKGTGHEVVGNTVGLGVDGDTVLGNASLGVVVTGTDNVIGGTDPADRNVISGNFDSGVWSLNARNQIIGNYIGTDATGQFDRGNRYQGVVLSAEDNLVDGNLISGNDTHGIWVSADQGTGRLNEISGNQIGTDATGLLPLGNTQHGIILTAGTHNNWIGSSGDPSAHAGDVRDGNVIAANGGSGIVFSQSGDNIVRGNLIGLGVDGQTSLPHPAVGIYLDNSPRNLIGTGPLPRDTNVVSASGYSGIELIGSGTVDTVIANNYIGTDRTGTLPRGNGTADIYNSTAGILLGRGTARTRVGTDGDGLHDDHQGNLVSGNIVYGILIVSSHDNTVAGNKIGSNVDGTQALGNLQGLRIVQRSQDNQIGGTSPTARNLISGNNDAGLFIQRSSGTSIVGNFIGTDLTGQFTLGRQTAGIWIRDQGADNTVGTNGDGVDDAAEGNLISGNNIGVRINNAGSENNVVAGNKIGTDVTGALAVPNLYLGVMISDSANHNRIGGSSASERNVISGNAGNGVIIDNADANHVVGNLIGMDASGQQVLGNAGSGIHISGGSQSNVIGSDGDGGVDVAEANVIVGSWVGVSIGSDQLSAATGVPMGTTIRGNSIYGNGSLGIDLGSASMPFDGVSANDSGDGDVGPNGVQNYPELAYALLSNSSTLVWGELQSQPSKTYTIDFYSNDAPDPSMHGEGQKHVGWTRVTTDATGVAHISHEISAAEGRRGWITATATDADGNTSEFSALLVPDSVPPMSHIEQSALAREPGSSLVTVPVTLNTVPTPGSVNADVAAVSLYVSVDGAPFQFVETLTAAPYQFQFVGESNHTYGFQSIAHDLVGNIESKPAMIEASVYIPDVTAPTTSVRLVEATSTGFMLGVRGSDTGGSGLDVTEVYVQIDGAPPERLASLDRSRVIDGMLDEVIQYNPVGDGTPKTYRFYSIGIDQRGNSESAPLDLHEDIQVVQVIQAPTQLMATGLNVQQGAIQRSFIRNVEVAFNQAEGITDLVTSLDDTNPDNDRVRLTRFALDGTSEATVIDLSGKLSVDAVDQVLRIDFGSGGIGGDAFSTQGDGYYVLDFDFDGDAVWDQSQSFYRLLGDTNGDRRVDATDYRRVLEAWGAVGTQDEDINGDGVVTVDDLLAVRRSLGRQLNPALEINN